MTEFESMMLAVCFGAVLGTFIGNAVYIIKDIIETRKYKKNERTRRIRLKQRAGRKLHCLSS